MLPAAPPIPKAPGTLLPASDPLPSSSNVDATNETSSISTGTPPSERREQFNFCFFSCLLGLLVSYAVFYHSLFIMSCSLWLVLLQSLFLMFLWIFWLIYGNKYVCFCWFLCWFWCV